MWIPQHGKACRKRQAVPEVKILFMKKGRRPTHGLSKHPLFAVRGQIISRCEKKSHHAYRFYGARGIGICEDWKNSMESFYNWAMNNGWKKGLTIDRIDNSGNYEPSNCRFVDMKTNNRNTRKNVLIEFRGETKPISVWCEIYGISTKRFYDRVTKQKWSIEKTLLTPIYGAGTGRFTSTDNLWTRNK